MSAKEITSLLLFAVAKAEVALPHISRLKKVLAQRYYEHAVPILLEQNYADGDVKWIFDFSAGLGDEIYYDALEKFLQSHEQFILDVLGVDAEISYNLSAQLSVDEGLASFKVAVPKIPSRLNALRSFHMDYSVWHFAPEGEATGKLQ